MQGCIKQPPITLTESDKRLIKVRLEERFSVAEIAEELNLSEEKINEYVENRFISFKGKDGKIVLEIIRRCFNRLPIAILREMIAKKDLKLQEKICFELEKNNHEEYTTVKDYFRRFEESQNFFEIDHTFSIEAKTCIRASALDNVGELSLKLNRMERLIRDYLLQYSSDLELLSSCEQEQLRQIQNLKDNFGGEMQISHTTYRMIISDSFASLIEKANKLDGSPMGIFIELLPLVFYYIKCSLPLDELTHIISNTTKIPLTTLDIFHLMFQMSDPVVRGLCIEHYSFSNPVPFYYPILGPYPSEQTSCQFEICKELWYSLQQFSGLVSFGLGWASWNLIGKSHLLDLLFETDFVKGSPQNSPFHLGSIDIQMTKNIFGLKDSNESTQWAYIDCHRCSDINLIQDICQNLDIALIHVSYSDYTENYPRLLEDLNKITSHTKHVYVLIRDCAKNNLKTDEEVVLSVNNVTFIFIPNLIKYNEEMLLGLKNLGYRILHSKIASPKLVESNFLQNLITQNESWMNLEKEKELIEQIKDHICGHTQDIRYVDFSSLSYYPHFVNYMRCFYKTTTETDQKVIDELNRECEQLVKHLENAEMNSVVWHFNEILSQKNSTLILWKLSQELAKLFRHLILADKANNQVPYTLEIFWREALLSSKFNSKISQDRPISQYYEIFSSNFSNYVARGEPFELVDGDNLRFFNQDINALLSKFYQQYDQTTTFEDKSPPIVVSIFGPQSSGKSTLLNYCFGCKFLTSAGRCTKGIYASLSKLSQPINNSDHFLILDTEGLDSIEREGLDSMESGGLDSRESEGLDSNGREGLDSRESEGLDSIEREGLDSMESGGLDSRESEGLDSNGREGLDSRESEGLDSNGREGLDSRGIEGLDSRERERLDSKGREGLDSKGREGLDSKGREGLDSKGREGLDSNGREGLDSKGIEGLDSRGIEGLDSRGREGLDSKGIEGLDSRGREGLDSREREGLDSNGREGLDSKGREGLDSKGIEGLDSRGIEGLDSREREGLDSNGREGLDSKGREGLDSKGREGLDSREGEGLDSREGEGLDSRERENRIQATSCIHFDRTMVLFCLAVSQVVIINVKGDLGKEMQNLLQICAYSLNKLKVSRVKAPKIFFILNQQVDPDPNVHLKSINRLLKKLDKESYLMETERLKISDIIDVSRDNLFVLPSAFNSESLNTQTTKLFDSNLSKLSPTIDFANKCTNLRVSIIQQLKTDTQVFHDKSHKMILYTTMSEWMEMSGVIWDTIIKYQDIVKYRNTDEIRCSNTLSKILYDIMKNKIHSNKSVYQEITKDLTQKINKIAKWCPSTVLLVETKRDLDDKFKEYLGEALKIFAKRCKDDSLLRTMGYMCDEAQSNLKRLIYMEKRIYEDKLKFKIKAKLIELEITENMQKFQQAIENNVDEYFDLSIEEQTAAFEGVWLNCFRRDAKNEEDNERDEIFDGLYSVFRMESKTMENKQTIYSLFRNESFKMDKIIQCIGQKMLSKFRKLITNFAESDHFIFPWKENRVPIKEITPYLRREKCEYLSKYSFYSDEIQGPKPDLKFREWVPTDCYSLIKYCSGYYNHPDIVWSLEKRKQILLLASQLKDPNDSERSTWDKFIYDISERVQEFTGKDPNISHSTVKEIVNSLCHICKAMNYEINFIEAKLTNAAERMISTYAFALALKPLLETKIKKQREKNSNENKSKELNLKYFLQKVENQKMARGNWDRKKMREGDQKIANIFAKNLLAAVWRGIRTACEQSINEKYFDVHRDGLSHESILLLANEKVIKELSCSPSFDENNFVVQFVCDQKQTLKRLFQEEWDKIANKLRHIIFQDMKKFFVKEIATLQSVLTEMLDGLVTMCTKSGRPEGIGLDSDSNFEVADNASTEVTDDNSDSKAKLLPLKVIVLFLKMYLDPKVSPEEFNQFFTAVLEIDNVKMIRHHNTYVLFEKLHHPVQKLDEEIFQKLSDTNIFASTETIFNIKVYIEEFLHTLNSYEYQVIVGEYEQMLKDTKEKFETRIINCPNQCPSCGKFCEKEIHPQEGKCQILKGHQICSMGGNVWNTNEDKTAILLMCEDYKEDTSVLIPGQNMMWGQFKDKCGDQWDWTTPTEEKYVAKQKKNRNQTIEIWNKYGKEILKYYANRGRQITYIPYTSLEEINRSLFQLQYYICFVIDGTDQLCTSFKYAKKWVSDSMINSQLERKSNFRVIVYHGHHDPKSIEEFPNNSAFTSDEKSIQNFLENITTYGEDGKKEITILHGLATAAKESKWELGYGNVKNCIAHFYMESGKGYFNIYTVEGKCDGCHFDWKRDIKDRMSLMKIKYKYFNMIPRTHPDCRASSLSIVDQPPIGISFISETVLKPKPAIFIDINTDD